VLPFRSLTRSYLQHSLITKGVPSVSSPVRNLVQWNREFGHEKFVQAVTDEFKKTYGGSHGVEVTVSLRFRVRRGRRGRELTLSDSQKVDETELERNEYVKSVSDELQVSKLLLPASFLRSADC
jgi:lipoate---protein ligase